MLEQQSLGDNTALDRQHTADLLAACASCSPQLPASGGGDRGTKRKRTTGSDCDDSEVKVVRARTDEDERGRIDVLLKSF